MFDNKILGGISLGLFLIAIIVLLFVGVLVIFPTLQALIKVDAQLFFIASDVLALFAAVLGFFSRRTVPGKAGGIGGLVTFVPLTIFLAWILVASVRTQVSSF